MAGIDPLTLAAIGAATGAVGAGLTKGDPLQGAIMGGAMGGLGGAIGGAGGAAGLTGGSAGSVGAATAFPVAAQATIPAQALTAAGASAPLLPQSASLAATQLMTPQINPATVVGSGIFDTPEIASYVSSQMTPSTAVGSGIFDTPEIAAYVSDQLATPSTSFFETMKAGLDPKMLAGMQGMMPSQQKQPQMQAPNIRKGQAPKFADPMLALLEEQKKARPQRRRLSLV